MTTQVDPWLARVVYVYRDILFSTEAEGTLRDMQMASSLRKDTRPHSASRDLGCKDSIVSFSLCCCRISQTLLCPEHAASLCLSDNSHQPISLGTCLSLLLLLASRLSSIPRLPSVSPGPGLIRKGGTLPLPLQNLGDGFSQDGFWRTES